MVASETVVSEAVPERRMLFRRLVALAGLGIAGALFSQEKAGLLPSVHAYENMLIDFPNIGSSETNLTSDVTGDTVFAAYAINGSAGLKGETSWSSGAGVIGHVGTSALSASWGASGVFGQSDGTSDNAHGVTGYATGTSGFTRGVYGQSDSPGGIGVHGLAVNIGVQGESSNGTGVYGQTGDSSSYGVEGINNGGGTAVYGETNGTGAGAVTGHATHHTGQNAGVSGFSNSSSGYGVYGVASATGVGNSIGVYGQSNSTSGFGVEGYTTGSAGVALWGLVGQPGAKAIIAQGASGQTANLQEWQRSDGSALSVVDANGNFGVGTTSPQSHLFVVDSTTNPSRGVVASQNNSGRQAALMQMTKSRGTQTAPGAVVNGDYVAAFNMNAHDGTNYLSGKPMAGWGALVNGTVSTGSVPADLFFYTKPSGTLDPYGDGVVRVVISSAGNVGIGTTNPSHLIQLSGGAYSNGSTWVNASDRSLKENFTPLDEQEILNRLETVPIQKWNYKNQPQAVHIGPVAQDFYAAYQLGDSDKSIGTIDADGIAFAAIKALHKTMKEQQERIAILERTVKQLTAS